MGNMSGSYGSHYTLWQSITQNGEPDVANNKSNVTVRMYLSFDGSSYYAYTNYSTSGSMTVNGTTHNYSVSSINFSSGQAKDILLATWTGDISHNSDGTKTLSVSGSWNTDTSRIGSGSCSASKTLTTIARYANLTSLSVKSRTVNSITLSYTTDRAASLFINLNNGESWLNGGQPFKTSTTSGELTIYYKDRASTKRLDPNTTYNITVLCRNYVGDILLDTSKDISATTYNIATINSAANFNLGDSHVITYSNPMGNSISALDACLSFTGELDDISYRSVSKTGTTYQYIFTDAELDKLYKKYGVGNSITVISYLRTTHNGVAYYSTKNINITLTGNQKTIRINASSAWKRGKLWTNVNGTWKRGVLWTNVNGTWKRGI